MNCLIKNSSLFNIETGRFEGKDLLLEKQSGTPGKVLVEDNITASECGDVLNIIDLHGDYLIPGFCDIRCVIGEITGRLSNRGRNELLSAHKGGFGCVCSLPDGYSYPDTVMQYEDLVNSISAISDILPMPAVPITKRNSVHELVNFEAFAKTGCRVFCEEPDTPASLTFSACEKLSAFDALLIVQPCEMSLVGNACVGRSAIALGNVKKMPDLAESLAVAKAIMISKETGCRIHIPCVSLSSSVQQIRMAKKEGIKITCSTAPQYFSFDSLDILRKRSKAKILPPLRTKADVNSVIAGIQDRTIDCISSDNYPLSIGTKTEDIASSCFGSSGFITAFPASYTMLVKTDKIKLSDLVRMMSITPYEILCGRSVGYTELISALGVVNPDFLSPMFFIPQNINVSGWISIFEESNLYGKINKYYSPR